MTGWSATLCEDGAGDKMDDAVAMYLNDTFAVPVNLAGLPGIFVLAGLSAERHFTIFNL